MEAPTLALKLSHNTDEMMNERNVNIMMRVWQKRGINSVKNIMGRNFSSGYFTAVHETIELNRSLNQLKMWRMM
jgi:hypothetical protein